MPRQRPSRCRIGRHRHWPLFHSFAAFSGYRAGGCHPPEDAHRPHDSRLCCQKVGSPHTELKRGADGPARRHTATSDQVLGSLRDARDIIKQFISCILRIFQEFCSTRPSNCLGRHRHNQAAFVPSYQRLQRLPFEKQKSQAQNQPRWCTGLAPTRSARASVPFLGSEQRDGPHFCRETARRPQQGGAGDSQLPRLRPRLRRAQQDAQRPQGQAVQPVGPASCSAVRQDARRDARPRLDDRCGPGLSGMARSVGSGVACLLLALLATVRGAGWRAGWRSARLGVAYRLTSRFLAPQALAAPGDARQVASGGYGAPQGARCALRPLRARPCCCCWALAAGARSTAQRPGAAAAQGIGLLPPLPLTRRIARPAARRRPHCAAAAAGRAARCWQQRRSRSRSATG